MSEELKTLKDIIGRRAPLLNVNVELLRQEAIKHIKSTEPYKDTDGDTQIISTNAESWIRWFFNITEEDLKDD